jgi:hypothetical protein
MPKLSLFGVFRMLDEHTPLSAAPLQLTRRAAEADLAVLVARNPETTYVVLEAHLKEPKP